MIFLEKVFKKILMLIDIYKNEIMIELFVYEVR